METVVYLVVFAVLIYCGYRYNRYRRTARRGEFIDAYRMPQHIRGKLAETYPHLDENATEAVIEGLRDYFHVCNTAGKAMVAMPSQVVDAAWHEFILTTRAYDAFCAQALGRFLHHTPAAAMTTPTSASDAIRRAWRICCHREGISPKQPSALPRLFALDAMLSIPDGFTYVLDCKKGQTPAFCAGHIGCSTGCAGDGGDSDGGDGGGGCGGD